MSTYPVTITLEVWMAAEDEETALKNAKAMMHKKIGNTMHRLRDIYATSNILITEDGSRPTEVKQSGRIVCQNGMRF